MESIQEEIELLSKSMSKFASTCEGELTTLISNLEKG